MNKNNYNSKGEKEGYWEEIITQSEFSTNKRIGHYKDGKEIGRWTWYNNNVMSGVVIYYPNLMIEYHMVKNLSDKIYKFYRKRVTYYNDDIPRYVEYCNLEGIITSYFSIINIEIDFIGEHKKNVVLVNNLLGDDKKPFILESEYNFYQKKQRIMYNNIIEDVNIRYDNKERIIQVYNNETIFAQQKYNDKGEIIYYKDYLGNFFDLSIGNICYYNINEIYEEYNSKTPEDDPSLKKIFSRFSDFTPQYKIPTVHKCVLNTPLDNIPPPM